jgi:uncharacterized phage protein (TIGR02218 family)
MQVKVPQAQPNGFYRYGVAQFLSGENIGRRLAIKDSKDTGELYFAEPWPQPIAANDVLQIKPGCDKRLETCGTKFNNRPRFRGMPFTPAAQTLL